MEISENQSSGFGGGIYNSGQTELVAGQIGMNNARQGGGGLYNSGLLNANQVSIIENTSGPGYDGYNYGFAVMPMDGESTRMVEDYSTTGVGTSGKYSS